MDEGSSGFLCAPRSVEALAQAMARMAALDSDARTAMGRAGRAKMEREFDERLVHAAYIDALVQSGIL
jgi:glycosyltransferase involved in cell wall biosynthesis